MVKRIGALLQTHDTCTHSEQFFKKKADCNMRGSELTSSPPTPLKTREGRQELKKASSVQALMEGCRVTGSRHREGEQDGEG